MRLLLAAKVSTLSEIRPKSLSVTVYAPKFAWPGH